jgi:hypothetical protein
MKLLIGRYGLIGKGLRKRESETFPGKMTTRRNLNLTSLYELGIARRMSFNLFQKRVTITVPLRRANCLRKLSEAARKNGNRPPICPVPQRLECLPAAQRGCVSASPGNTSPPRPPAANDGDGSIIGLRQCAHLKPAWILAASALIQVKTDGDSAICR